VIVANDTPNPVFVVPATEPTGGDCGSDFNC